MTALGLDVGGANLKAALADGTARTVPFPLWRRRAELADAIRDLVDGIGAWDALAVTMTGELCDCFSSRREGVLAILDAIETASQGRPTHVWQTDGRFVDVVDARTRPLRAAASNWLALATFVGRLASHGAALLVDVGSTSTDIVPLVDGIPVPRARDDTARLRVGELIYTGVRRTPVCSLLAGDAAAELFATTLDVYLLLGLLDERPEDLDTADGRPATRTMAHARMARMLCADAESLSLDDVELLARTVRQRQVDRVARGLRRVIASLPSPPTTLLLAGSGEFLARQTWFEQFSDLPVHVVSLSQQLGARVSEAACAHAVAVLADERRREST